MRRRRAEPGTFGDQGTSWPERRCERRAGRLDPALTPPAGLVADMFRACATFFLPWQDSPGVRVFCGSDCCVPRPSQGIRRPVGGDDASGIP